MRIDEFVYRLGHVRKNGNGFVACCPAHDDKNPSLSIVEREGKILLKCFAGCQADAVVAAMGLEMSDLFVDERRVMKPRPFLVGEKIEYRYQDENGRHIFSVFRQQRSDGSKAIWSYPAPGFNEDEKSSMMKRYIYKLPDILNAIIDDGRVYICEGEKCCDAMWKIGLPATTNAGGAGKWMDEHSAWFKSSIPVEVVIIPDNDGPGKKHALQVANSLYRIGARVKILELPGLREKEDIYDWLAKNA